MKILAYFGAYFGLILIFQVALRPDPNSFDWWAVAGGSALIASSAYFALCAIENAGRKK